MKTGNKQPERYLILFSMIFICFLPHKVQARNAYNPGENLPASVRYLLHPVRQAMSEKNYSAAIELIHKNSKRFQNNENEPPCGHPVVCFALGNCHLFLKEYAHAESAYLKALDMAPGFTDARLNLAKVYADSNQCGRAAKAFLDTYEDSDPRVADYLYYAAVMTLMNGQNKDAVDLFESLFYTHPGQVSRQWKENFARALITAELWQRALPLVQQLAETATGEDRVRWQETLLQIHLATGDLEQAKEYAVDLSRASPANARWWKALVHIHLNQGSYDRALENLIIYGFVAPLSREEKILFADLSLQLQIPARAVRMYEGLLPQSSKGEKDSTEYITLIQHLVIAYRQMDQAEKALNLLNRFDPEGVDNELLMVKGDLLYEAKKYRSANQAYRMAAQKNCSQKGQAWLMAGYAAWQQNDFEASRSAFKNAARFKRQRKDAMAAMAQLERTKQM
ncbi:MAG: tetratricopeptide repeat protein [Desulfobacterales bacterium]|nr:tetratricopeptide repeat protein [Desulfobacterales bacterium]